MRESPGKSLEDATWSVYNESLYPNEETFEYMRNQKVVGKLAEAGDKLDKERLVEHWIYFTTEKDRECFVDYATRQGFNIDSKDKTKHAESPFQLKISRSDKVDLPSISQVTLTLRKEAGKCEGDYDGWETVLVK